MPGMVAEVALQKKDSTAQYIIPANIVQLDENNQSFVWLNNNGKAEKRIVSCGEFTPTGVTVVAGLKATTKSSWKADRKSAMVLPSYSNNPIKFETL